MTKCAVVPLHSRASLACCSKEALIEHILTLDAQVREASALQATQRLDIAHLTERVAMLNTENTALKAEVEELSQKLADANTAAQAQERQAINAKINQPSSKKPEWDKDGNLKSKRTGKATDNKQRRKKRTGSGNRSKTRKACETHLTPLLVCPECQENLQDRPASQSAGRLVEDIAAPEEETRICQEVTEMKWCPVCKKMVRSKSERALPGSDIGLNATVRAAYLWIVGALSLANIQRYLAHFNGLQLSTAGLSRMMIRLGDILTPIAEEIRHDVKTGNTCWADETGWRVKGKLWWLWVFGNKRSAYYWGDRSRGSPVVEKILGPIFAGILIADGWSAYHAILCARQSCAVHVYRKIRAFIDAYPRYRSVITFYRRLRQIIRAGERLQKRHGEIKDKSFIDQRRRLHKRLQELLSWKKPNPVLEDIIAKVRRQQAHLLTFIDHPEAESHNNFAERLIKAGVLKRKVSGGSMSESGLKAYACLQSIAMTCRLRGLSFHRFMLASLTHYIRTGKPMLLSEYETHHQQQDNKRSTVKTAKAA